MTTDWRTTYNDLCKEIEILEIRADEIKGQMSRVKGHMQRTYQPASKLVANYSGMPGSGFAMMPFEQICSNLLMLEQELDDINDVLTLKREARRRMESKMDDIVNLTDRVMIMRDVQRKPLKVIADELGYSYDWIKRLSSRAGRLYKVNVKRGTIRSRIS